MDPPSQSASEHAYEATLSLHLCKSFSVSLFLSPFVPVIFFCFPSLFLLLFMPEDASIGVILSLEVSFLP